MSRAPRRLFLATLLATPLAYWSAAALADDPAQAAAAMPAATATQSARPVKCTSGHEWQHLVGLVLDAGQRAASYGVRYMNAYKDYSGCGGLGVVGWVGYGAEIRGDGVSAVETQAVGRAGMGGDASSFGIELAAGGASTLVSNIALGTATFLVDFYYFGVGASYRFPIGSPRPPWLGEVEFALRIHVPVFTYGKDEKQWTDPSYPH
jgi:hypothetical protein